MRLTKKTMQIQVKHRLNSRIESIVFVVYVSKVGGGDKTINSDDDG